MTENEMIERVASAISTAFHEEGYIDGLSDPAEWAEFQKAARLVLEAMLNPTPTMINAGAIVLVNERGCASAVGKVFTAMIQSSLK